MPSKPWTSRQRHFLRLLSSGSTPEKIAQELKVSPRLLSRWRSLPGFQEALEGACLEQIMGEMPRLLQALTEKAKEGNVQAAKILFDYVGQLKDRNRGINLEGFNEEERQKAKSLLKEIISLDEYGEGEAPPGGGSVQGGGVTG